MGVQYILGLLAGGAGISTVMRGASFPEGGPIFLAWGCQISWGDKFPVTPVEIYNPEIVARWRVC